jgi:excinuclease ABC subunit C
LDSVFQSIRKHSQLPMQKNRPELAKFIRSLPQTSGVYLMKDRLGQVIYVGKAKNLKRRVSSYFQGSRRFIHAQPKIGAMVEMVREISIHQTRNEPEALLLEGKLIKEYKPRYNTDFTDDKQFLLVHVDWQSEIPRFRLRRNRVEDGSRYYGPFARAGLLRSTLAEMRKKFGILLADGNPTRLDNGKIRLYDDARAEIFAGQNETTLEEYRERVERACEFLEGKAHGWLKDLKIEMNRCAEALKFEEAARLRDLCDALHKTIRKTRKFERKIPVIEQQVDTFLSSLAAVLELNTKIEVVECFDVSHVSGTFVVASMVRFVNGKPDKRGYRKFKIRSFDGNDDFRAMNEVVGRRYGRLLEEKKRLPDLVVIDGGLGQVSSALAALDSLNIRSLELIGLAKREETIVFGDSRDDLQLSARHPARRFLQIVRDEAHRFANRYNADLRSKRIRESVLEDFKGLGEKKRNTLLAHFGSMKNLKKSTVQELMSVDGIGKKMATDLHQFLTKLSLLKDS